MKNEFYIDMISKSIISSLSNEIAGNTNSYIKEFLEKEFSSLITDKIKAEIKLMAKQISGIEKMTAQQAETSAKEIKGEVGKIIEKHLAGYAAEMDASMKEMKKELSDAGEIKTIVEASGKEIKDHISEMGKVLEENSSQDTMFKDELNGLKQSLLEIGTEQEDILKGEIEGRLTGLSDRIGEFIEEIRAGASKADNETKALVDESNNSIKAFIHDEIASGSKAENELVDTLSKDMSDLNKAVETSKQEQVDLINGIMGDSMLGTLQMIVTLLEDVKAGSQAKEQEPNREQEEMLSGVFYSVKKLMGLYDKEKEVSEKNASRYVSALSDIRQHIEDNTQKLIKLEKDTSEKASNRLVSDFKSMSNSIENSMDKFLSSDSMNNNMKKDLSELKEAMQTRDREQNELLNGVFYSIKKLTNSYNRDSENSDNTASLIRNTLEDLYGHIRRLESDKSELSVELLRLAGDDFMNSKFDEMEKELKKSKKLAERYRQEKKEMEDKLKEVQQQLGRASA